MKKRALVEESFEIYNCHIHTFTKKNTPSGFYKFLLVDSKNGKINVFRIFQWFIAVLLLILSLPAILIRLSAVLIKHNAQKDKSLLGEKLIGFGKEYTLSWVDVVGNFFPAPNDFLERYARFLNTALSNEQFKIFERIKKQYPENSVFVVLPMDFKYMGFGEVKESLEDQHRILLDLAHESNGQIIPFYAADPRREDLAQQVRKHLKPNKFQGVKIYPNLGYDPNHDNLQEVYKICEKGGYPVITHCSTGGIWQYKLSEDKRKKFSEPENYIPILKRYPNLRLCLAHFGGQEEWAKHLQSKTPHAGEDRAWVRMITDMITEIDTKTNKRKYPNLYTDISYTIFAPRIKGLYIDLVDYLKVLLSNKFIRESVLFGSDYYMVEQEAISEKEASILLRSRLGEDLYKQIAHTNPERFLGIR